MSKINEDPSAMQQPLNSIQFVFDEKLTVIDFSQPSAPPPTTTVLNYLRSLPGHKGAKEGCAEGDCGACTVVVAEPENNNLVYKAINSCIVFLPFLHGKQLITVENLSQTIKGEKVLHPVQQLMIELHGSQCGYCSPGIVMSLFALYKNHRNANRATVEDALAGNLCRCTGYQPIIEAGIKAVQYDGRDHFSEKEKNVLILLKEINSAKTKITVNKNGCQYYLPFTLDDCLAIYRENPTLLVVNGATDVALLQTKKMETLNNLLDISHVAELNFFRETENVYEIGASFSLEALKKRLAGKLPVAEQMLEVFASKQIRNTATPGGNIVSASPIADSLPVWFVLDASVKLISSTGYRTLPIYQLITGYRTTALLPGELLYSLIVPKPSEACIFRFYKISKRRDLDISTVSMAAKVLWDTNKIKDIMLVYGGMAATPLRAGATETFLKGKEWTEENAEKASLITEKEFSPISDARSGKRARSLMAKNLIIKLFSETQLL